MGAWIWLRTLSMMVVFVAFGRASVPLHSGGAQPQASGGFASRGFFFVALVGALNWLLGNLEHIAPRAAELFVAMLLLAGFFYNLSRGAELFGAPAIFKMLGALLMGAARLTL